MVIARLIAIVLGFLLAFGATAQAQISGVPTGNTAASYQVSQPAFSPRDAATVSLAVTTSSASAQVQNGPPTGNNGNVRIYNSGSVVAFCQRGISNTVTASATTGFPVAPGEIEIIGFGGFTYAACVASSGTTTVYFTPGDGL